MRVRLISANSVKQNKDILDLKKDISGVIVKKKKHFYIQPCLFKKRNIIMIKIILIIVTINIMMMMMMKTCLIVLNRFNISHCYYHR